ncbi:phage tail tape measure protein, partial [Candidatus Bathyarchaeota archaeon]
MAAVGGNNVYVDIIFRLQAEAAKRAERIIGNLIKRGQLATIALQKLSIPKELQQSSLRATHQLFRLAQQTDAATRASSALWQQAVRPLTEYYLDAAGAARTVGQELENLSQLSWEDIQRHEKGMKYIRELGLTEQNYVNILKQESNAYKESANAYENFARALQRGELLTKEELELQRALWNIYQRTGVRLKGLSESAISLGKKWESLIPLSERAWQPTKEQIEAVAKGLSSLDRAAAEEMMTMTRNAAIAKKFNEPIANLDASTYKLVGSLDKINFRLAQMGITFPITAETSKALAQAQAQISDEALAQTRAFAESAASLDRLGLSARGNLALGSQLYDIFTGNSRMALELEDSVRAATGVLDRHARGLHLVNRALREQNANFAITQETINRITQEGWGAFTEEQKKALQAIKKNYETTLEYTGVLDRHERALLRVIRRTDTMDRALHFQLRTAEDAAFLLKRLKTEGYEALTAAEKRAIDELERNIALTRTWDSRTKALAQRIIDAKNAYKEQGMILRELTPRQRAFYGAIFHLQGGMRRLSRFIDRVSISSLKLLGPIFLATAAFNTFSRIVGECVSSFTEYEDRLIDLRVAGEMSLSSVNRLSEAFISLEKILPISATQLAEIATLAAKAGITGTEQIKAFTLAIAKFTKVTGWSADQASDALLKISRAFSLPIENSEKLASMMHHLAVVSVADAKDIVNAMTRVGAAATNLGITADMAAAMATTLIDAGMGAERAGTRLRAFFREFLEKSNKIAKVMEGGAGFQNFAKIIEDRPAEALRLFLEYLYNISDEVERSRIVYSIFGSVASFAVLTLVEHYDELTKRMEEAERELTYGTRLTEDFSVWMDAASTSIAKAENSINRLQRAIGAGLAPVVTTVSEGLASLLEDLAGIDTHVKITTRGFEEWREVFSQTYPLLEDYQKQLTLLWYTWREISTAPEGFAKATEELGSVWQEYIISVESGGDVVFGVAGKVLDILEEVGARTKDINDLEDKNRKLNEDIKKARELQARLEKKYGRDTLEAVWNKLRAQIELNEEEEKYREAAIKYGRILRFINKSEAERADTQKALINAIRAAADSALAEGRVTGRNAAYLARYIELCEDYDKFLDSINKKTAIGVAILSKYGPLYADLKNNINPKLLAEWSAKIEEASKSMDGAEDELEDIIEYLETNGYTLTETTDGWRLYKEAVDSAIPTSNEIADALEEIKKSAQDLNKTTPEEFLDSLDEGWRSIEKFMSATASAT